MCMFVCVRVRARVRVPERVRSRSRARVCVPVCVSASVRACACPTCVRRETTAVMITSNKAFDKHNKGRTPVPYRSVCIYDREMCFDMKSTQASQIHVSFNNAL